MKTVAIVLSVFVALTSCYEYSDLATLLDQSFQEIDFNLDLHKNSTLENFYVREAQSIDNQFQVLAKLVEQSGNPYGIAHVIEFRQNYSAVSLLLEHLIDDARKEVVKVFAFQRDNIEKQKEMVRVTSNELFAVLERFGCTDQQFQAFYYKIITETKLRVTDMLKEGMTIYFQQLTNTLNFRMYQYLIEEQLTCLRPESGSLSETTDCMVKQDDLYLGSSMEHSSRTINAVTALINHSILKITHAAVKDIDYTFVKAYKDAYTNTMECNGK